MQTPTLRHLADTRFRIAGILTTLIVLVYFGFIALVAFAKPVLARTVVPGLSLGILLGALVIVISWISTWFYVWWANKHYDPHVADLRGER